MVLSVFAMHAVMMAVNQLNHKILLQGCFGLYGGIFVDKNALSIWHSLQAVDSQLTQLTHVAVTKPKLKKLIKQIGRHSAIEHLSDNSTVSHSRNKRIDTSSDGH